jgi:hypothetical protein
MRVLHFAALSLYSACPAIPFTAQDYLRVLDGVAWDVLQQEEVLMLVHWCLQLPQQHAFTHGLQAKVLGRVAQQLSGE